MGVAASSARNNDELIDNLLEADCLATPEVEIAMRLVDRGHFFPDDGRRFAYKDMAWRSSEREPAAVHLSAPSIYANVLENLELLKGNSFLNIGSGTGYLNSIVGFLIGDKGVNHGIEIHPSLVEYGCERVEEMSKRNEAQCFEWKSPTFTCGNGLLLDSSLNGKYDRVYCGANVPSEYKRRLWELINVGGILVMPSDHQLIQVKRKLLDSFDVKVISAVSFSDFITPSEAETSQGLTSFPPDFHLPTLQDLCRIVIRSLLRDVVSKTHKLRVPCRVNDSASRNAGNNLNNIRRRVNAPLIVMQGSEESDDDGAVEMDANFVTWFPHFLIPHDTGEENRNVGAVSDDDETSIRRHLRRRRLRIHRRQGEAASSPSKEEDDDEGEGEKGKEERGEGEEQEDAASVDKVVSAQVTSTSVEETVVADNAVENRKEEEEKKTTQVTNECEESNSSCVAVTKSESGECSFIKLESKTKGRNQVGVKRKLKLGENDDMQLESFTGSPTSGGNLDNMDWSSEQNADEIRPDFDDKAMEVLEEKEPLEASKESQESAGENKELEDTTEGNKEERTNEGENNDDLLEDTGETKTKQQDSSSSVAVGSSSSLKTKTTGEKRGRTSNPPSENSVCSALNDEATDDSMDNGQISPSDDDEHVVDEAREEEIKQKREDIDNFARAFMELIEQLPLNKALVNFVKSTA